MKRVLLLLAATAMLAVPAASAKPPPKSVTLSASKTVITYGASTTLAGKVAPAAVGESVAISSKPCGASAFTSLMTVTSGNGGAYSTSTMPTMNTAYQAKVRDINSGVAHVWVRPRVTLTRLSAGQFQVTVTAAQSFVGKWVRIQYWSPRQYRYLNAKRVTLTATDPTSIAPTVTSTATFTLHVKAKVRVRALLPQSQAGNCYLSAHSNAVRS